MFPDLCGAGLIPGEPAPAPDTDLDTTHLPPAACVPLPLDLQTHLVEPGETLSEIASRYQLPLRTLADANALRDPDRLAAGHPLQVPLGPAAGTAPKAVTVEAGDTLSQLARQHGKTLRQLINANLHSLHDPDRIATGTQIWVPGEKSATPSACIRGAVQAPGRTVAPTTHTASAGDSLESRRVVVVRAWEQAFRQLDKVLATRRASSSDLSLPARTAMQTLEHATRGLEAPDAAALLDAAVPGLQAYDELLHANVDQPTLGPVALSTLLQIEDRAAASPQGQAAIDTIAQLKLWNASAMSEAISRGIGIAHVQALATQPGIDAKRVLQAADDGMDLLQRRTAEDALRYAAHLEELGWLVSQLGGVMTPDQLGSAIDDYTSRKGPAWQAKAETLKGALTQDGSLLLKQATQLAARPGDDLRREPLHALLQRLLGDPLARVAIVSALQHRPEIVMGRHWQAMLAFFSDAQYVSTAKMTDQVRKLTSEAASAYLRRQFTDALAGFDPARPETVQQVRSALLAMKSSRTAMLLGVSQASLEKTVSALEDMVPLASETRAAAAQRLSRLDALLQDFKGFDKSTAAGRLIRCAGIALAGVGFIASADRMLDDFSLQNSLKVLVDAAGLSQKGAELLVATGRLDKESTFGRLGGSGVGKFLGVLTAGYDLWNAAEALQDGEYARGALYGVGATGSVMAAYGAGLAGPAGFLLVGSSVFGLGMLKDARRTVAHEPEHDGGTSLAFLMHAGLTEEAARSLVDQSDDGHSIVPLLALQGRQRGFEPDTPAGQPRLAEWINTMPPPELAALCKSLRKQADNAGSSNFPPTNEAGALQLDLHMLGLPMSQQPRR